MGNRTQQNLLAYIKGCGNIGYKRLSDEEERNLVEEYRQGAAVIELQRRYNFSTKKSITDKVKKYYPDNYQDIIKEAKNNRKSYSINLEKIDSDFKAYLIGLLLTDGYIHNDKSFGIQMTDEDVIKFVADTLNAKYHTYYYDPPKLPEHRLIIYDSDQVENIKRFGIVKNKSHIMPAPNLYPEEEKYLPYLIRGVIDGDGCIYKTTHDSVAFYICTMSIEFAEWLKYILEEKFFMRDVKINQAQSGIWCVGTSLNTNIMKLIGIIYDKPFGMSRKYNRLREMFRDYNKGNQQDFILNIG